VLSPGRPLQVSINANKRSDVFAFAGMAKPENDLLGKLRLEDGSNLPFVKALKEKNSYASWSVDSVINFKLPQIKRSLDSTQNLVQRTVVPTTIKAAISTELQYFYANAIAKNVGDRLNNFKNRAAFNLHYIDMVWSNFPVPSKGQLDVSISANNYLDIYLRFKAWKAMYMFRTDTNKVRAAAEFKHSLGVAYQELANDPDRTNEIYMMSTRIKTIVPEYAWEKHLSNLMFTFCMQGQLQSADKLLHFIRDNCTDANNIAASEKMFAPLKLHREQYAGNLNIKIRPDYKQAATIQAMLAPYKGKVVFVDMWGTWCPHCIEDMVFEPALKERMKGKDIVFLYVASDEDKDDEKWRDFIFINNLTGEHVRRTSEQIAPLWNELGVIDSEQGYPHYFIADRTGKIVVNNAKRPSNGDALYGEIEAVLNK